MDSATPPAEHQESAPESLPSDYSTPLLETLFTEKDRRYQAIGSLIYGLLGIAILAIGTSAFAGLALAWEKQTHLLESIHPALAIALLLGLAAMVYPTVVMALQIVASCRMAVTVRVVLIYAILYACLRSITFGLNTPIDGATLLFCAPICLGGFLAHQFRGWNAVSWSQEPRVAGKISIASLLDLTAAIAITMGIASTADINPQGLPCLLPTFFILAVLGMHPWARLFELCDDKQHRESGFALWMVGSILWGCGLFLLIAMTGLIGIVVSPLSVLIAHYYTTFPIKWLTACGWRMVRVETNLVDQSTNQAAIFNSSI